MPRGKRVEWDEDNLEANAEYQRQHPVTMHITEPKTPYAYVDDDPVSDDDESNMKWDPAVNAKVKEIKERVTQDQSNRPQAPITKAGRPMLAAGTTTGELEAKKHDREFRQMRKAVYADEGAMFKKALTHHSDEDEDDSEEDNE